MSHGEVMTESKFGEMKCENYSAPLLLALNMEEGAMSQRMWVACGSCKKQGNGIFLRTFRKEHSPEDIFILARRDLC